MKRDLTIFILIYLIAFAIVFGYGMTHVPVNDAVNEYLDYQENIKEGWHFRYTLVNSSLVTTWLPSLIYRATHWNEMFIFRLIPALFYPLMPAFGYLIARRYLKIGLAVIAPAIILLNSHFIYFPDIGRVGVALGFLAGMIWAMLGKRFIWAITFAVLVVFSHYGTSLIAFGLVLCVLAFNFIVKFKWFKQTAIVLSILAVLIGAWHFGIARYSGKIMGQALFQTEQVGQILPNRPNMNDLSTREPAVQAALNVSSEMPTPEIIEIVVNWVVVLVLSFGLLVMMWNKKADKLFKLISLALYGLIVLTVALPWLSTYYGGMRVYFTAMSVLAVSFICGIEKLSTMSHVPVSVYSILVLIAFGLCTSGLIYRPFGMVKMFPVMVVMP